jgi:hypothetical protein
MGRCRISHLHGRNVREPLSSVHAGDRVRPRAQAEPLGLWAAKKPVELAGHPDPGAGSRRHRERGRGHHHRRASRRAEPHGHPHGAARNPERVLKRRARRLFPLRRPADPSRYSIRTMVPSTASRRSTSRAEGPRRSPASGARRPTWPGCSISSPVPWSDTGRPDSPSP